VVWVLYFCQGSQQNVDEYDEQGVTQVQDDR